MVAKIGAMRKRPIAASDAASYLLGANGLLRKPSEGERVRRHYYLFRDLGGRPKREPNIRVQYRDHPDVESPQADDPPAA
jgi:hypothetical protein